MSLPVAIVGASGYTGAELLRLLLAHPRVHVGRIFARRAAGAQIEDVSPQLRGTLSLPVESFDPAAVADTTDIAFTALPHGDSARAVAALRERGVTVVDLSADFRLRDAEVYARWYGGPERDPHPAPALLERAVYGLPERYREALRGAELVAGPGCYPTASILAIAPLLERGLVEPDVMIDAKSGASGAGRSPSQATHLPEAGEGVRAYKIAGGHRHTPELVQELGAAAGGAVKLLFTPHLLPMSRGLLACVYARPTGKADASAYREALLEAYEHEPFVSVLPPGGCPDTAHVRGSNRAHVSVSYDEASDRVLAMCAIDNLVKGASGQAIQCLNLARGWDERDGLVGAGLFP
jgi:N-acetyl-gamma-glutamyl-phosphate reductase